MVTTTKRRTAGSYEVTNGSRVVTVTHFPDMRGWIAQAEWDRYLYTDPVPTRRDAVRHAQAMLSESSKP